MKIAIAGVITKKILPHSLGGTEQFTYLLVDGLVKHGHSVTLFCAKGSETPAQRQIEICQADEAMGQEATIEFVYPYTLLEIGEILKELNNNHYDILHISFLKTFLVSFFADQISMPILYTMHRDFFSKQKIMTAYEKIGFKKNEHFVFVSQRALALSLHKANSSVVYNGIPLEQFPFSPQSADYFLWLSRVDPLKGPSQAIQAAMKAGVKLEMVGDVDREKHREYFETEIQPFLSQTIRYQGPPGQENKIKLYQNAKAFLFPIQWEEPFGLVMAEAMACGTPVIAYNRGSVPDIVRDGITGFVIDPDDEDRPKKGSWIIKKQGVEGLVEAIKRIDQIDRKACRKHVEEHFSIEKTIEGYEKVYQQILANKTL